MIAAMAEVAVEHGAANVTVAHVVERAGVSRRTFYEAFEDGQACFLAAFEEALARVSRSVLGACDPDARWVERMRASLLALLCFLDEEPFMGRLLVVESLAAGPGMLARRRRALAPVIAAIERGGPGFDSRTRGGAREKALIGSSPLAGEGVVGGVLAVLHERLSDSPPGPLVGLAGPLMAMIVLPYLGAAAARRELERPLPPAASPHRQAMDATPLTRLHMRLTYRTIRVLTALAAEPGSSNRHVAEISGVSDQGQMSKLLARLCQLGLIENTSPTRPGRGDPNAWTLTSEGWRIQSSLTQHLPAL
jgi:AcrR family transcriptional regulator